MVGLSVWEKKKGEEYGRPAGVVDLFALLYASGDANCRGIYTAIGNRPPGSSQLWPRVAVSATRDRIAK